MLQEDKDKGIESMTDIKRDEKRKKKEIEIIKSIFVKRCKSCGNKYNKYIPSN